MMRKKHELAVSYTWLDTRYLSVGSPCCIWPSARIRNLPCTKVSLPICVASNTKGVTEDFQFSVKHALRKWLRNDKIRS